MQTFDRVAIKEEAKNVFSRNRSLCVSMMLIIVVAELILSTVSAGFLGILFSGIIAVTAAGFFTKCWQDAPIGVSEALSDTFDEGFLRKMGGMLWMQLKVFLWSLLFVIPGIIKSYSYALTPYILSDYPNVLPMEACRLSEKMMRGHRVDYFVTELSFLGWGLLSAVTMGILHVLYVGPYIELTQAGIYEELKQIALDTGAVTQAELDGEAIY
ncbi:MAG: DUF975 family protein [Clostridia bacterium]|nr:DUF975 family protein [Clostridia bacterium]